MVVLVVVILVRVVMAVVIVIVIVVTLVPGEECEVKAVSVLVVFGVGKDVLDTRVVLVVISPGLLTTAAGLGIDKVGMGVDDKVVKEVNKLLAEIESEDVYCAGELAELFT